MATTIKLKNGSGAPDAADLVQGEPAFDLTNKRLYTENASGTVIEIGTSPSTIDINAGTIDGTVIGGASAAAGTFTTLTATGNVVLGDAATDTVTVTADVASDLIPSADGTYDLGASGSEWQDLYIDGTANIDSLVADTADINGGTIDGTVIGGASAAAGTFTTLTTSSTVTHNGGTANGVAYLNGSKVLTTGSALTFDGTNLTVPAEVYRTSATSYIRLAGGDAAAAGAFVLAFGQSHATAPGRLSFGTSGTGQMTFDINGSEQMRLTSTGLGIGTTSPSAPLHIKGGSGSTALIVGNTVEDTQLEITSTGNNSIDLNVTDAGNNRALTFSQSGTERMRIDSSGHTLPGADNTQDLGSSTKRWNDLFLGGSVYLGGTTSANALDDYEEGTWTPVLAGGTTPGTYELDVAFGTYTKIGRLVYVSCAITLSAAITGGGTSYAKITGLPFNYDVSEDSALTGHLRTAGVNYNSSATQISVVRESGSDSDAVAFLETFPNAAAQFIQIADFAASDSLAFTLVYHTT